MKIGRNDPCPCGSGKKYKHCCYQKDQAEAAAAAAAAREAAESATTEESAETETTGGTDRKQHHTGGRQHLHGQNHGTFKAPRSPRGSQRGQ